MADFEEKELCRYQILGCTFLANRVRPRVSPYRLACIHLRQPCYQM